MTDLIQAPTASHVVYIPFILLIGIVIGFVIGRRAGVERGKAEFIGGDDEEV